AAVGNDETPGFRQRLRHRRRGEEDEQGGNCAKGSGRHRMLPKRRNRYGDTARQLPATAVCRRDRSGGGAGLLDVALDLQRLRREVAVGLPGEEAVETATVIDRAERRGSDPEAEALAQRVARERDVVQVRQEAPPGLVVGVTDVVSGHHTLTGQFATARHGWSPSGSKEEQGPRRDASTIGRS